MATSYTPDDMANVFVDEGVASEAAFWLSGSHGLALAKIPWGADRVTQIAAAAAAKSITLTALSTAHGPWQREQEFWRLYAALV